MEDGAPASLGKTTSANALYGRPGEGSLGKPSPLSSHKIVKRGGKVFKVKNSMMPTPKRHLQHSEANTHADIMAGLPPRTTRSGPASAAIAVAALAIAYVWFHF